MTIKRRLTCPRHWLICPRDALEERRIKLLLKDAVVEVLEERHDLLREALQESLEERPCCERFRTGKSQGSQVEEKSSAGSNAPREHALPRILRRGSIRHHRCRAAPENQESHRANRG